MKLRISGETIAAAVKPYQFSMIDIISITPRLSIGDFNCCAINLVCNKVLIVAQGIVMTYNKLEDFMNGCEPASLVADETISYDQGLSDIDFKVLEIPSEQHIDNEAFSQVRELMFGAREANIDSASDDSTIIEAVVSQ